jgi:hypothetical protein
LPFGTCDDIAHRLPGNPAVVGHRAL